MPIYKCNNKKCKQYLQPMTVGKAKIVVDGYQIKDLAAPCPICNEDRETIKDDGFTTQIHGGPNIPRS